MQSKWEKIRVVPVLNWLPFQCIGGSNFNSFGLFHIGLLPIQRRWPFLIRSSAGASSPA